MNDLTAYEAQVLIGTSISGCNMAPDQTFDLTAAWAKLYAMGLIDRTDGLAIVTPEGVKRIAAMLAARHLSAVPDGEGELVDGPWRLGGYAPGSYMCICLTCNQAHEADKRATQCVNCAAREAASRLSQAGVRVTDEMVATAMREAWDDICSDTGCHPDDIQQVGRKRLEFSPLHWARFTAQRIRSALSGDTL